MSIPDHGAGRLDAFVRQRLAAKRMSWADLARSASLGKDTIYRAVKQHRAMRPETLTKLDVALDWPIGTCAQVIAGGAAPQEQIHHAQVDARLQGIERMLTELTHLYGQLNRRLSARTDAANA